MAQVPLLFIAHAILLWVVLRDAPNSVQVAGLITLAITPATLAQQYGLGILQGFGRFSAFNLSKLLPLMSFAVALICLAAAGVVALGAVAVAFTASYLVFGASTLRRALRVATQEPSSPGAGSSRRALTVFGLRGFIGASPPVETYRVDQALVAMFLLPRDLGLYIVALSFVNFPRFLAQGIGVVAYSRIAASPDPQQARRSMWKFFWLSVPVYGPIILALALLAPILLPFFFGAVFASAVSVCQLLLINVLFICMRRVLSDGIRGLGYPSSGSRAEIATFVALLPLSVVLIPDHGIKGTAWALIASSVAGLMWLLLDLRFVLRRQTPVAPADAVAKAEPPGAPVDGLGPQ
jgi:O-antigen/teichoic acid export membrane protein